MIEDEKLSAEEFEDLVEMVDKAKCKCLSLSNLSKEKLSRLGQECMDKKITVSQLPYFPDY